MRFNLAVRNDYYYVNEDDNKCYVNACGDGLFAYCDSYKCKCLKNCKLVNLYGYNGICKAGCGYPYTESFDLAPLDDTNECILKTNIDKYYYTYYIENYVGVINAFYATGFLILMKKDLNVINMHVIVLIKLMKKQKNVLYAEYRQVIIYQMKVII